MKFTPSLLLCTIVPFLMRGQAPVADFKADIVSGCAQLTVNFTDLSTGSPKTWNWDFGNGQLSNQQNPSANFPAGTYSVTLVVRNSDGLNSITKTNYIVSNPAPGAYFTADKTLACLPGSIQFTDGSVANAGTINKWEWIFGDGGTSGVQNPSHTFTAPGFYDVYLKVTSTSGCAALYTAPRYIRMVNGVKADFNYTGPTTCKPPFNVAYKNLTSGPGTLTYTWDLGNATSSTQTSPSATYNTAGSYTIKLSAKSDIGCSDSVQKTLPINGITTSFTASKDSVCLGSPVGFQNTTAPPPVKTLWNFGDGTTSSLLNPPQKTYSNPGTYPVTMYSTFAGCMDSAKKNIYVFGKPFVDFSSSKNNSCKAPLAVAFNNLSPDAVSLQWSFGDGSNGTGTAPTHSYTVLGKYYTVGLTITDSKGCTNSITKTNYVTILSPLVNIQSSPAGVCVNGSYNPIEQDASADGIASFSWDFGDASPPNPSKNPSHVYTTPGTYTVKLTITTNDGCTASDVTNVQVANRPVIDFSKDKDPVCRSGIVTFTNSSTPPGAVIWDFNDGSTNSSLQNPIHKFTDTGLHNIKLTVTANGCTDSLIKYNFVHVLPPLANFAYKIIDCANKATVGFSDSSLTSSAYPPISYLWNFGDPGNSTSPLQNPSFTYPSALNITYNAQLIVNNGACADTITKAIQLIDEKASFTMDKTAYCRNEQINMFSTNSLSHIKTYTWVDDGVYIPTDQAGHFVNYPVAGTHTAQLIVTDINGCSDTGAVKTFTVTGPTAKFTVANKGGCSNSSVTFNDASVSSSTGTINKWVFDFGDGKSQTFTAPPFTHTYADTGYYTVKLTVFDNISSNCSDTYTLSGKSGAVITKPVTRFNADTTTYCPGAPLQFKDSSSGGGLTYAWSFGDGGFGTLQNPLHAYAGKDSMYSVKLVVTDSVGCADSLTRTNYINIRAPKPFYTVKDTATLCPPLETKFTYAGKDAESFNWDFGDGGSSSLANPNHFYNTYGVYTAKLYVTGYGGCLDSASININVTNPNTATAVSFSPSPAKACNNLTVNFTVTPPYSTRFKFFFGDGVIDSSQQHSFQHFYNFPNQYYPVILLSDSVGCEILIGNIGGIDILGALPLFGMDKKKFCDSGTVYFTDYSLDGHDAIVKRTWDFNDGGGPVVIPKDTLHRYTKSGLYVPSLTVTTAAGCTQTFTDTVRVLATPQPLITGADGVCTNVLLNYAGSLLVPPDTAISWTWDFGRGQISNLQNPSITYSDTGLHRITLRATNSAGCKGDTFKNLTVFPLPVIAVSGDTSIVAGTGGIAIPLTYSTNAVSYNWTPPANLSCTDCPNPYATPKLTTTYNVKVTDANGCTSNRNITLIVVCNNKNFYIPNTFSPNNDGSNDRFYPRGTGLNSIQALRIFNRWGEMVYQKRNFPANDAASGWDGTYKGKPAATDTYIYMVDIICENASIITYKGNVTLIR